jgi:hypothetical protein
MKKLQLICLSIAIVSLLAGLSAAVSGQVLPAQAAETLPDYGAGAYPYTTSADPATGKYGPIGGGTGYSHYYNTGGHTPDYVVTSASALQTALSSATSGEIIWIPDGTTITWSSTSPIGTLKTGAILASNRGQNGAAGGKIVWTTNTGGYMEPLIKVQANAVVSGLSFQGPGSLSTKTSVLYSGNCCLHCGSYTGMEIENCYIWNFANAGITFNSNSITWNNGWPTTIPYIHHCDMGGSQQPGMGYLINSDGTSGAFLVEACKVSTARHLLALGSGHSSYEIRYCEIGDAWQYGGGQSATEDTCQLDWHGPGVSGYATRWSLVHHNTFSTSKVLGNIKVHCGMRGKVEYFCDIHNNWSKRTDYTGAYPTEANHDSNCVYISTLDPYGNPYGWCRQTFDTMAALYEHEGGSFGGAHELTTYNMFVHDNWWGSTPPPGDETPPTPPTPPPVGQANLTITKFEVNPASCPLGQYYNLSADIANTGDASGSGVVRFGWMSGSTHNQSGVDQSVSLAAGGTTSVGYRPTNPTSLAGTYTMYCQLVVGGAVKEEKTATLTVTSTPNHAPVLGSIGQKSVVAGTTLSFTISATDADGDALTYAASDLPADATFTPSTQTFSWTPASGQVGTYAGVHFQVSDGEYTDSEDITITATANNPLSADVNSDGAVNALDMIRIGQAWGQTGAAGWTREDVNKDGKIDVLDATLVGQYWTG